MTRRGHDTREAPFVHRRAECQRNGMKTMLKKYLDRLPYIRGLKHQAENLRHEASMLRGQLGAVQTQLDAVNAEQGMFPPGHYYSSIPATDDIRAYIAQRQLPQGELPGIRMNTEAQRALLEDFAQFYPGIDFPEQPTPGHRYYFENVWFSYSDAILLHCFLRKYQPKRIIEVGSGFSSAVMLDTIDRHYSERPALTFIEPYPERLKALLTGTDAANATLFATKVQEVPLAHFDQLEAGDLLFIDSSHVVKTGSDLQFLLFDVLPRLRDGVFVHFHDVFYPFDYPDDWLTEGRHWNENYFLRAFLSWNAQWEIRLFGSYVHHAFAGLVAEKLPLCARNFGGSLYLQRVAPTGSQ
jgi:predicted O-methyltransferase YrrM